MLSDGNVRALYEDKSGVLWVGTKGGGLNRYDRLTDSFKNYQPIAEKTDSLSGTNVSAIFEDSKGRLWIGTHSGVNLYNRKTETFTRFQQSEQTGSISHNEIRSIYEDLHGNIWIGTAIGLNLFDNDQKNSKSTKMIRR